MISVIIPAYNVEHYIKRCLDSILCQAYEDYEVIVINDGSTDRSGEICDQYAERYSQIRVIHQENAGEASARNRGLEAAGGDYIVFVDADDCVYSCLFQSIIRNMDDSLELLLLSFMIDNRENEGEIIELENFVYGKPEIRVYSTEDRESLIEQCFYGGDRMRNVKLRSCCGKVFRSSFLRERGIRFPEEVVIGPDMLFMLQVYSSMKKAKYCSEIVYHYFFHNPASITNRYKPELESIFQGYAKAIGPWLEKHPQYRPAYSWYRMNDIILYMKYDFFHPQNEENAVELRTRMARILRKGFYRECYELVRENKSLRNYGYAKRFTFWCAVNGNFRILKLIYGLKYGAHRG